MKMAKLGLYIDEQLADQYWSYGLNVFARFLHEVLGRMRIPYQTIGQVDDLKEADIDILIAAFVPENQEAADTIWSYIENGGSVISLANCNYLAPRIGYRKSETVQKGYAKWEESNYQKLRFLKAVPWYSVDGHGEAIREEGIIYKERPGTAEIAPLFQHFKIGNGTFDRCSVDIAETIVKLHQGSAPIFEDGAVPADGSADTQDQTLKVDDLVEMDWQEDRMYTETGQSYFAHPYADLWREVFIQYVIKRALHKNLTLPFVGYWPDGVSAVAMISHDSDGNQDEHALSALNILKNTGIKSTWCMLVPGYSQEIYKQVIEDGHELAFHYNAVKPDNGVWGRDAFHSQLAELRKDLDGVEIVSNKNHLTRFEGWGDLFKWCEETGIQSDQTNGPSKKGNGGFLFGTCHPYFPIAWSTDKNRFFDVLETGFLTPDIDHGKWADSSIIEPYLDQVKHVHGLAHFLFHQVHLHRLENVRNAYEKVIREARKRDFVFWKGNELNDWERNRRTITINEINESGKISFHTNGKVKDFVIYRPVNDGNASEGEIETVFNIPCEKIVVRTEEVIDRGINA